MVDVSGITNTAQTLADINFNSLVTMSCVALIAVVNLVAKIMSMFKK